MLSNKQEMAEYLLLIKKITNKVILNYEHNSIKEDVVQEAFIKLFKQGFFEMKEHTGKPTYIHRTVHSCYLDKLKGLGYIRMLTKAERESSSNKTENIKNTPWEELIEDENFEEQTCNTEDYFEAKEAYQWIKNCFDMVFNNIKNKSKQKFFDASFWWQNDYGMPIKTLAEHIGFSNSNPTQEFNRLVKKVSNCTEEHGITINDPHEQIQFLQEQILSTENSYE